MSEVTMYEVQPGDCVLTIAENAGLLWKTVWEHPNNSELQQKRKDPNVLLPGDVVAVPNKTLKEVDKPTDAAHKFVRKGIPAKLKLRLLQEDKPRAGIAYLFKVDSDIFEGKTDSEGYVSVRIPPGAQKGKLILLGKDRQPAEEYDIQLGHLDPHDELVGVQKRLQNLGFNCTPTGEMDDATKAAVSQFRAKHNLEQSEEIDDQLKKQLKAVHGS
jgi:hypothetical protein